MVGLQTLSVTANLIGELWRGMPNSSLCKQSTAGVTLLPSQQPQSADMCHRVQSLLTSPKSPTATATCFHLLFDIISRGRVWVRGDYDSFIHSTIGHCIDDTNIGHLDKIVN